MRMRDERGREEGKEIQKEKKLGQGERKAGGLLKKKIEIELTIYKR